MTFRRILKAVLVMGIVAAVFLLGLSTMAYIWKWNAFATSIGISISYMVIGFFGGKSMGKNATDSLGKKVWEGVSLGTIGMACMGLISVVLMDNAFTLSARALMIWIMLMASAAFGRLL